MSSLVALEAAARHLSFTKAAHELSLSEGAVSRTINKLEDTLGVKLFSRVNRGVVLTPAGALYSDQIKRSLEVIEKDTLDIMTQGVGGGKLELAVLPTLASEWLIPRLDSFYKQYPDVSINMGSRTGIFLLEDSPFDAAIHYGQPTWPGTVADHLFDERIVAVCQPEWARRNGVDSPEHLLDAPLLHSTTRPDEWRKWFDAVDLPSADSMRGARYELHSLLISAAICGHGVALLPEFLVASSIRAGVLMTIGPTLPRTDAYYLVYPAAKAHYFPLTRFRSWLQEQVAKSNSERHPG